MYSARSPDKASMTMISALSDISVARDTSRTILKVVNLIPKFTGLLVLASFFPDTMSFRPNSVVTTLPGSGAPTRWV